MYENIIKAKNNINPYIIETECDYSKILSDELRQSIFVKYDNRQLTGSFKYRGSINKLLSLNNML